MKAISFLGAGPAYETTYVMPDGRQHTAPYFPAALVRFFEVDELLVFVTKKAKDMHFDKLLALTQGCVSSILPIPIPDGRDESELWRIFQAVADEVAPEERLIFDITHGFRSLPFLSFLAAAYLRSVKDVRLEAVVYGALEAGDKTVQPVRAPVIDLTRFVTLLDWLNSADQFARYGDAGGLARLLRDRKALPVHLAAAQGDQSSREVAGRLRSAAEAVEAVSQPLSLVRPVETMAAAAQLEQKLAAVRPEVDQAAWPFALITDRIRSAYAPFGLAEPIAAENCLTSLGIQRRLLRWYVEHRQYIQAATLAREWLVSYVAFWMGWDVINDRELAERVLTTEARMRQQHRGLPFDTSASQVLASAADLWNEVSDLRNDLAHLGFRPRPRSVRSIISSAHGLPGKFDLLQLEEHSGQASQSSSQPS